MLQNLTFLTRETNHWLCIFAVVLCSLGSGSAFIFVHDSRRLTSAPGRRFWLAGAAILAGFVAWATDVLCTGASVPWVEGGDAVALIVLSLVAAIGAYAIGFAFARSEAGLTRTLAGAAIGAGMAAAQWIGVAAFKVGSHQAWEFDRFAASIVVGAAMAAAALWIGFLRDDWIHKDLGALGLMLAIAGHHVLAMDGSAIRPDAHVTGAGGAAAPLIIAAIAAGSGALLILAGVTSLLFDTLNRVQAREQILKLAFANIQDGLVMFDAAERIVSVNDRYKEIHGLPKNAVNPGMTLLELLQLRADRGTLTRDPAEFRREILRSLATQNVNTYHLQSPSGGTVEVTDKRLPNGGWMVTQKDVTERVRHEQELKRTRDFLRRIIENVPAPITVKSGSQRRFVLVNQVAATFLGMKREDLIGKTVYDIMAKEAADRIHAHDELAIGSSDILVVPESSIVTPGNGTRIVIEKKLAIAGLDGGVDFILTVIDDVTDKRRGEKQLAYMAHHDALTSLPNRTLFGEHLNRAIAQMRRHGKDFAVLSLDLDRFKQVNDTLGHQIGDKLLCDVALRLRNCLCETDVVARFGGDEFVVLSTELRQRECAGNVARRLVEVVGAPYEIDGQRVLIGASVGIALSPDNGDSAEELLRNADLALYRAKAEGKGTFAFFATEMDVAMQKRRSLEIELRDGIAANEFEAHFQPLIDLVTGSIVACETLVRWRHPTRGFVSPAEFIPLAEENGSIVAIGESILRQACCEAVNWPETTRVAVNLSSVQFKTGNLCDTVRAALAESGLEPRRLQLEVTESILIAEKDRVLRTLLDLRALGVHVSLDDFGTGYSSLSYLSSFPFDMIKIDRTFVQDVTSRPDSAAIVRAITSLAATMGMSTTAEGVESAEELNWLRAHGCTQVQGFLFSPAVSAMNLRELLKLAPTDLAKLAAPRLAA